jgi:iron transport multicopper oxidase
VSTGGTNEDGTAFMHSVAISATVTSPQVGVIFPNGTAVYQYLGCYFDGAGRQLSDQLSYNANQTASNENGQCQKDCYGLGYTFAATEYSGTLNHSPLPFAVWPKAEFLCPA